MRFSTATLLTITLLFAVGLALSRFDFLLMPIAFPFTIGPLAAYRATPSRAALFIGFWSSAYWMLVAIVPFAMIVSVCISLIAAIDRSFLTREIFVMSEIVYFLAASVLGGYVGGVVARPD